MIRTPALATTLLLLASPVAAQVIVQGTVFNTDSVRLVGARIEIADSTGRTRYAVTADSTGDFLIRIAAPLPAGRFAIRSEMLGYQTVRAELLVEDRQIIDVLLTMAVAAIPIEPLRVSARRRYTRTSRDEYYDRADEVRRMGGGTIIDYDQLQRRLGSSVTSLVAERYPGVRNCPPSYFIDGMRATADDLRTISVMSIEGIEIYRTVGQVPIQYQNRASCGAVLIWTQVGDRGEGSPLTLKRLLIAAGLIGIGILILR